MALRRSAGPVPVDDPVGGEAELPGLPQQFVDEITWYMREHKVSRVDLARSMNVSPGRVSQILSGDENLTLRTLSGVLAALGARLELTIEPVEEPTDQFDDLL